MGKIKLFCIPYAGGSAMVYNRWKKYLHRDIELYPIELAGRGKRYNIPFYTSFHDAVDDLFNSIKNNLDGYYALLGHSMGSWLTLELAYKISELGYNMPIHIFFSGNRAPHLYRKEKILHKLPDDEFKREIFKIGGTPKELFENKELLEYFLPVLRADFKILENYNYKDRDMCLNSDISVFNGIDDNLTDTEIEGWGKYTKLQFKSYNFNGGHFFINEKVCDVLKVINYVLVEKIQLEAHSSELKLYY
jgi:medium-chain acyl-[acyl-carrier-protein] hydrolase